MDHQSSYSRMSDEELLLLAAEWSGLTPDAQTALARELDVRKLKGRFENIRGEGPTLTKPSGVERAMFWLSFYSAAFLLLSRLLPETTRSAQLYEIFAGVAQCLGVWLIVWLVARVRRVQRDRRAVISRSGI